MTTLTEIEVAHTHGPETEREAAALVTNSGKRETHGRRILAAVRTCPGSTAGELGYYTGLGDVEARRRLYDLWRRGLVTRGTARKCSIQHTRQLTYYPIEKQGDLL